MSAGPKILMLDAPLRLQPYQRSFLGMDLAEKPNLRAIAIAARNPKCRFRMLPPVIFIDEIHDIDGTWRTIAPELKESTR